MGGRWSRREVVPQSDSSRNGLYKSPPPDGGNFFSSHFRLGHRRYETGDPEYFLFGDLTDLNFLAKRPVQFPYPTPKKNDPLHCLQLYVNIHRDSVKLVKSDRNTDDYFVSFEFNSDVDCRISLLSSLPDGMDVGSLRDPQGSGLTRSAYYHHNRGSEVKFTGEDFPVSPGNMSEESLTFDPENGQDTFPIAILIETADVCEYQSQLTLCTIDKSSDGGYNLKVARQKIWVSSVEYLLHEMYGLENKSQRSRDKTGDSSAGEEEEEEREEDEEEEEEEEDLGAECVVCITDVRDTLLLPCRHLCLCASCAANLRYQSNNCPICRTPFKALLQVTALQPLDPDLLLDDDEITGNPRYDTLGYEKMPVLEALNGYRLKLPCEAEDEREEEEEDTPTAAKEEGGGEEGEVPNGTTVGTQTATDTVISVEEDPEIEALSAQPLAMPPDSTHSRAARQRRNDHTHIDLEQGHDIPGLVTTPEVEYKGVVKEGGATSVVSVVLEEVGREEREAESSPLQENVSHSSEASTTSYSSTKELLTKY